MLPRRSSAWLPLIAFAALPFACAPERHPFLTDPEAASGASGSNHGGSGNSGRGGNAAAGQSGHSGAGQAGGESSAAGEAGFGGEAGAGLSAGTGSIAGGAGSSGTGGSGGAAAGSGGATAGAGGATAGAGGTSAGSAGALAGSGGGAAVSPTIVDTIPANQASGVRADQSIVVVFSQPMNKSLTEAAFDRQALPTGTFSWSADSKTLTYKPDSPLLYATGTAPASTQARLYSYAFSQSARSSEGLPLAAAQTVAFKTARSIALELSPSELWSVKSSGVASQCLSSGGCTSLPIGDDSSNFGLRGVFRYSAPLVPEAFVQDVQMYVDIRFSSGSVEPFGTLLLAKTSAVLGTTSPSAASFVFTVGPNGTSITKSVSAPGLISNGSFGSTDFYLTVQWSVSTDNDAANDSIGLSDGHLLTHYLIP